MRSCGIVAPAASFGPPEYAGTSWIARALTSDGDRIAAWASAGTGYCVSTEKVTLVAVGLRFDLLDRADGDAEDADLVAGVETVGVGEVRDEDVFLPTSSTTASRPP